MSARQVSLCVCAVALAVSFAVFGCRRGAPSSRRAFPAGQPAESAQRQTIPATPVLSLPPPAPLPPGKTHSRRLPPFTPAPSPSVAPAPAIPTPNPMPATTPAQPRPPAWEIIRQYDQVIQLSEKYYQTAVDLDRYGYANQAIKYYQKYLFVAPTGPHAAEVRSRLAELESSF